MKTTSVEGGDVYLASYSSKHVYHEAFFINFGVSFHMTPHRKWLCEYDKYYGGDVFLGDEKKSRIKRCGKVKLNLQGGRIRELPSVFHILGFAMNLSFVSKMDDAGVKIIFKKYTCKMV